jgi:hypothetical protein
MQEEQQQGTFHCSCYASPLIALQQHSLAASLPWLLRTAVMGVKFLRGGKPGRAPSIAACLAASTGSWPWNGVVVSNSWKMIMAKLYTSTFRL